MPQTPSRFFHPLNAFAAPLETVPVMVPGQPRPLRAGEEFTLLTWNLQFCASRNQRFFYEGGNAVRVGAETVRRTLDAVGEWLRRLDADIVLLQEVDRGADRTARIDEVPELLARAPYPNWTGCWYHRSRFVPKPWPLPMGRVDLWQVIFSRFTLGKTERIALPLMKESPIVQHFNLKRAILSTEILGDVPISLANAHLSAWSNGDGTLPKQMAEVDRWMEERRHWIIGGDFNALPPGDDPARLGDAATEYSDAEPPLDVLTRRRKSVVNDLLAPENRTYLPPGEDVPNRLLDYVFVSDEIQVLEYKVVPIDLWVSDHRPIWCRLKVGR